ncbi:tRNA glutamyl-Q(34) synthetase GluQRS [Halothiobacillus sp. DCM-1]|uniref:tRNA glutamyl-Q(34) synthetase GluQRS n=1 Tax=Halothiobacillus sp. DCM-1 TaxID=3112558 RepID=UPI00324457F1
MRHHTAMNRPCPRPYIGRFAPTPSGPLHAGSLVAALGSWLDARAHGGQWRVRLDDLDSARCPAENSRRILAQLDAHQLIPDAVDRQSHRHAAYAAALQQLIEQHRVYRCHCRRDALRASGQRTGLVGSLYPGTCRQTPPPADARCAWRLIVPEEPIRFTDRLLGTLCQSLPECVGDPILQRSDGVIAYHLAEVVDNHEFGITDVVRGADLAELTPLQLALHQQLYPTAPPPRYAHLPIVHDAEGRKLSKTNHAPPLRAEQAQANLIAAATHLGLESPTTARTIPDLLDNWRRQWPQWLDRHRRTHRATEPAHSDALPPLV